jgi:SAM-dependent methyltransferase
MTAGHVSLTEWGARAARLYDRSYADRYRRHDDELPDSPPSMELARWLSGVCRSCGRNIAVLDAGCGTGRYFWALEGVRDLVGLDVSSAMLAHARRPYAADRIAVGRTTLVEGDLLTHVFEPGSFDLVYSIGVLAEHTPLTPTVVAAVAEWLGPGGRFAFTAVRVDSPSASGTMVRQVGLRAMRLMPSGAALRRWLLHDGLYVDERSVRELLERAFDVESLTTFQSESHVHCLCVARKRERTAR